MALLFFIVNSPKPNNGNPVSIQSIHRDYGRVQGWKGSRVGTTNIHFTLNSQLANFHKTVHITNRKGRYRTSVKRSNTTIIPMHGYHFIRTAKQGSTNSVLDASGRLHIRKPLMSESKKSTPSIDIKIQNMTHVDTNKSYVLLDRIKTRFSFGDWQTVSPNRLFVYSAYEDLRQTHEIIVTAVQIKAERMLEKVRYYYCSEINIVYT